jgi:Uma2 family endonuclease
MLRILIRELGERALLDVQNPIQIRPCGQPQPDLVVLRPRADDYTTSHPTAADVLLLIEIADSSLAHDRVRKGAVYAQAGIADYWILNLVDATLMVYRRPVDGTYRSEQVLGREDSVQPLAFPDVTIAVSEILA